MERETNTMDWLPDETTAPLAAAIAYLAHGLMKAGWGWAPPAGPPRAPGISALSDVRPPRAPSLVSTPRSCFGGRGPPSHTCLSPGGCHEPARRARLAADR